MTHGQKRTALFPALLKHWRGQRGLSQLDLALVADVSSRHVSFLETGRSAPSAEMILRLGTALDVPLRHVNAMMEAAGYTPVYPDEERADALPDEVKDALSMMKQHHDPFPLFVVDRQYDLLDLNAGALALFGAVVPGLELSDGPLNLARLTFAPQGAHEALVNFEQVGCWLLWRMQREVLAAPNDTSLRSLLDEVLAMPTISEDWRKVDLSVSSAPTMEVHLRIGDTDLRFMTMITAFQSPQTVQLDELRIETWFPCDDATSLACGELVGALEG